MPNHDQRHHHHHYYYNWDERARQGYARNAGDPSPGPNRHWLYRNQKDGMIAGVCAGVADYFGWPVGYVRLAYLFTAMIFFPLPIFFYFGCAFFLPRGEPISSRYKDASEERFWRTYSAQPKTTLSGLRHRFRALEARVADMERAVTSNEFSLRRKFSDLEKGL